MKTEYPSRIDSWLSIVLVGAPLIVVAAGVFTLTKSVGAGIVTITTGLIVGGLIAALSIPCVYTLTDESLKIKSGLLEDEVPLRKIRGAEKSSSMWSAPALSLRRIKLTLDDGSRSISPKDRDGFITDLEARLAKAKQG
jgi:Bacterial PH domain